MKTGWLRVKLTIADLIILFVEEAVRGIIRAVKTAISMLVAGINFPSGG
jgi:hypothetical protein